MAARRRRPSGCRRFAMCPPRAAGMGRVGLLASAFAMTATPGQTAARTTTRAARTTARTILARPAFALTAWRRRRASSAIAAVRASQARHAVRMRTTATTTTASTRTSAWTSTEGTAVRARKALLGSTATRARRTTTAIPIVCAASPMRRAPVTAHVTLSAAAACATVVGPDGPVSCARTDLVACSASARRHAPRTFLLHVHVLSSANCAGLHACRPACWPAFLCSLHVDCWSASCVLRALWDKHVVLVRCAVYYGRPQLRSLHPRSHLQRPRLLLGRHAV